jgi:dihydrofolate reductase
VQELLVDFITSLDGYGGAKGWPGWWGLQGPEYLAWLGEESKRNYTFLMGANTYRVMSGIEAVTADEEASLGELDNASKVVFSSKLQPPLAWPNTQLVSGDAVEFVRDMKQNGSSPMSTIGSISLCRSLIKAGLVDRFRVIVFPVITGASGEDRIYDGYPDVALDKVTTRTFDGTIQMLEGVPRVLSGPPSATAGV